MTIQSVMWYKALYIYILYNSNTKIHLLVSFYALIWLPRASFRVSHMYKRIAFNVFEMKSRAE